MEVKGGERVCVFVEGVGWYDGCVHGFVCHNA